MSSTNSIVGLSSGLDWQSLISQMMDVERQPETLLTNQKTTLQSQYTEWTTINTKLAALQTSASALSTLDDFNLYTSNASATGTTTDVSKLASFTVGSNASPGSYSLIVNNLAQAQKLGSEYFNSLSTGLNISGDLVINGHTVNIATTDSLTSIQNKINALNSGSNPSGVIASIITVASGQYQLTLTSQNTGKNGMVLANGSAANVLGELGFADSTTSIRNAFTGGALSSAFSSSTQSIQSILGLTNGASGTVTIGGQSISINLASDSLESINDKINAAGISSSIVSKTDSSGNTTYTLQINGTQSFTDASNILQTLGILEQGNSASSDVYGVVGSTQNTTGGSAITNSTLLKNIDGYSTWTSSDTIAISDPNASVNTTFTVTANSTVGDLLSAIDSAYGNQVSAYVNSNGAIVVEDNRSSGSSNLDLTLTPSNSSLNLGTFSDPTKIRSRQIVAGADATITLDGNTITRNTNQISDVIAGTTISLVGADPNSTITLNITQDTSGIESKISDFVSKYNALMTEITNQFTYTPSTSSSSSTTTTATTPPLFGDSTLQSIKWTIRNTILSGVTGVNSTLNTLGLVGINLDQTGQLSINSTKLEGYLQTNFNDVVNLFAAQGSSTNNNLTYIGSGDNTATGSYQVQITQAATKAATTGTGFGGSLSGDTNLTLTDNSGNTAQISLASGSSMSDIVNAINSELANQSMDITASENADGQLVLSRNSYGSAYGFTVANGANLGISDATYTGTDVQGSICQSGSNTWMTMTGSGQALTGDSGQDVDGLVVQYTGTSTGTFDFTFSKGVGDSLSEILDNMSNSIYGSVTQNEQSIQNHMTSIDKQISDMEERITQDQDTMTQKFVAMETALSQLQAQQSWLTSELSSLSSSS
ncbi:MAG: flagellar filament capping protein FliD [Desulfomonilia bacterium]